MKIKDLILKTEKVNWQELKDLQPIDLKNNYHSDKTKKSIVENGFARAIYVWQDQEDIYIVDGHLRSDVLRELKNDGYEIPEKLNCTFLDLPDKTTAIKYLLQVFNQKTNPINHFNMENWLGDLEINLATDLKIDIEELHVELPEVEEEAEEEQEEVKEDEVPEVKHSFVVKGDLFELVDEEQGLTHRVLCGDSTMIDDVDKVMNGEKADMVFTDPPYGINYERHIKNKKKSQEMILNDSISLGWLINIPKDIPSYICTRWDIYPIIYNELNELGNIKNIIVWDKETNGMGDLKTTYAPSHEFIIYLAKKSEILQGGRERDVWGSLRNNGLHPTMKPISIIAKAIKKHNSKIVIDFFLGSGSTLIACQQTKRKCYGIELDEHYCGVVITRWKNYMEKEGKKYSIKRNGEEFNFKS